MYERASAAHDGPLASSRQCWSQSACHAPHSPLRWQIVSHASLTVVGDGEGLVDGGNAGRGGSGAGAGPNEPVTVGVGSGVGLAVVAAPAPPSRSSRIFPPHA